MFRGEFSYLVFDFTQLQHSRFKVISKSDGAGFRPERIEVAVFFGSLQDSMSHPRGPRRGGIAVLTSAVLEPDVCRYLNTHFRFRLLILFISSEFPIHLP
jgi:hypothetical protein